MIHDRLKSKDRNDSWEIIFQRRRTSSPRESWKSLSGIRNSSIWASSRSIVAQEDDSESSTIQRSPSIRRSCIRGSRAVLDGRSSINGCCSSVQFKPKSKIETVIKFQKYECTQDIWWSKAELDACLQEQRDLFSQDFSVRRSVIIFLQYFKMARKEINECIGQNTIALSPRTHKELATGYSVFHNGLEKCLGMDYELQEHYIKEVTARTVSFYRKMLQSKCDNMDERLRVYCERMTFADKSLAFITARLSMDATESTEKKKTDGYEHP